MTSGIYLITNNLNGNMYVGGSVDIERRFKEHKRGDDIKTSAIDKAIRKYGADNFTYQIIIELPPDWTVIGEHEKYWIKFYNTFHDRKHYNSTGGGNGVGSGQNHPCYGKHSHRKGISLSETHKQRISNSLKGYKPSDETKKKLSESRRGNKNAVKNYCRIIKNGVRNGAQRYAVWYDGDCRKSSVDVFKLIDWVLKEYPNKDVEMSMEVLGNALLS